MIHTLTIIRFLFPFLLLLAFFCLYKKPYRCMQSFMWGMVVFDSARKFYLSIMMLTLIFINWCCCMTEPNLAVGLSSILTLALLNRRIADSTLHILHERKRFWLITLLIAVVCYATPYMNSVFQLFFLLSVAAVFYPSERVLQQKSVLEDCDSFKSQMDWIMKNYY